MSKQNNKQRFLAIVAVEPCGHYRDGDALLEVLRTLRGAVVTAENDELMSFTARFDAASVRGATMALRRVRAVKHASVVHWSRIATEAELAS